MENLQSQQELNYDVSNALYLISKRLGDNYEKEKVSPFYSDFSLRSDFVLSIIKSSKDKSKVCLEDFLQQGNQQVAKNFRLSLENVSEVIAGLTEKLKSGEFVASEKDNIEMEIITCIDFLSARKKLLELALIELKNSQTDSFELYKEIVSFNKEIEEILEGSFVRKLEKEIIINQFIELQRKNKKKAILQTKTQNSEIIKENKNEQNYNNKYQIKVPLKPLQNKEKVEKIEENNTLGL